MADDALASLGLRPVELSDAPLFRRYFATLTDPLSDYTFAQIYTWRNSLHLAWREIDDHLCVFANGCGDLTLLVPPIGDTRSASALRQAAELMDGYNADAGVPDRTRVEYASDELLARLDRAALLTVAPMGTDYVYDTARMIDLAGGDLASKRQARNRFARLYRHRVEPYDPARHLDGCLALLQQWRQHQDAQHATEPTTHAVKRQKESIATELALRSAADLGLRGLVVHIDGALAPSDPGAVCPTGLRGFTLGEPLGADQSSIVIEKTDLDVKGLAQFIFSEFCRRDWADRPLCNVGDDWGLESLAWTKQSYRPLRRLQKYTLTPSRKSAAGYEPTAHVGSADAMPTRATADGVAFAGARLKSLAPSQHAASNDGASDPQARSTIATVAALPRVTGVPPVQAEHGRDARATLPPATTETPAEPGANAGFGVAVRPATDTDLPATAALERACFDADVGISPRQLRYLHRRPSAVFLVAEAAGRVVGDGIALVRRASSGPGTTGRIYSLVVDRNHRGRRVGGQLLAGMVEQLAARGVGRVFLEVDPANTAAVALYQRHGFTVVDTLSDYYGPGRNALHMVRELRRAAA